MDAPLRRLIGQAIQSIPAPEGANADPSPLGEFLHLRARVTTAVCLDSPRLERFEFEDELKAGLSLADSLLAVESC
jgi:hypothetical protein